DADGQKTDKELTFDADGKATFTLKDGQSLEILNVGEGVDYTVKEINLPAGFTSDQADNTKTGTISSTDADNKVTFTNTYNVTPITTDELNIDLGGTKSITGRDFQADDEFIFTIAAAQATPNAPLPTEDIDQDGSATTATVNPTSGDEVSFEFGDVTFDKPGEYRYVIRETTGTLPGIDYDGALYRVNIIIEDNGDGTLSLASVDGGLTGVGDVNYPTNPFIQVWDGDQAGAVVSAVAFENNYSAISAEATIQGTKVLNSTNSDRILADDDFTFTIEALGYNTDGGDQFNQVPAGDPEQPMPANTEVNNVANGNVIFGEMTFTQDMIGNTYGYKITEKLPQGVDENNPTLNGVTYDTSEKIVKVTVTRSDEGGEEHVVATVTPNDGTAEAAKNFTFTNTYEPSSVTVGEDTSDAITVQKTFTGRTWNDGDTFEYTLTALDGAPSPDQTTLSIDKPASGTSNTATFGDITFEKEGTYKYEITETKGNLGGVDYDEHTATVTVTVTENEAEGTLSAEVFYDNSKAENDSDKAVTDASAFTNTYKATFDTDTTVNLNGTKELTGKELTDSAFYFIVDPQETASGGHAPTGESLAWNPNKADGSIQLLKNVTYTEAGDYVYIIKEQIPSNQAKGMTYDESEYRVTVTVTDDQQGNLTASEPKIEKKEAGATDYTEVDAVTFTNEYEPLSGTYTPLKITKVLSGDRNTGLQEGEFSFEMSVDSANPEDGITLPQQSTVENAADGTVQFGNITFTKPGTYVVQVKEVVPADGDKVAGVTYDDHVIKSTFTVTDVDGQLTVQRTGSTGSQTFTNKYTTTGKLEGATDLEVTKNFTGRDGNEWLDTDSFGFKLEAADDATTEAIADGEVVLPDNADSLVIDAQDADHKAAFGDIIFNAVGEYTFKVTEVKGTIAGVTYDDHEATITVTTTDNGDGTLEVTPEVEADALTFANIYKPEGDVTVGKEDIKLSKVFEGAEWDENFSFDFTIEASDETPDAPMPEETTVTLTSDNAEKQGDGTYKADFGFGPFTFDEIGDYKYIVKEKATEDALGESYNPGIKYDNHEVVITISVTDNKQGGFATSVSYQGEQTFTNTYEAQLDYNAAGGLVIEKTLVDHDIADGQFGFTVMGTNDAAKELLGGDGTKVVSTKGASMDDDGNAVETIQLFDDMVFTHTHDTSADPEYTFTVKETTGGDEGAGYTNDETEYTVTINVIDDKQGGLTVETKVMGGSVDETYTYSNDGGETKTAIIPFTNTYEASGSLGGSGATSLNATKVTNGRDMVEGEFDFTVTAKSNVDQSVKKYATGSNVAAGDGVAGAVNFSEIKFTKESLNEDAVAGYATYNDVDGSYTYVFTVAEETDGLAEEGITPTASSFTVNVVVKDNNDGTLGIDVTYPQGSNGTLAFVNTYEAEEVPLTIVGQKKIDNGGWADAPTLADIEGKYTFTLTGVDEDGNDAPLPGGATGSVTANNDASGSVDFGTITYTLENVFGAEESTNITADEDNKEAGTNDEAAVGEEETENAEEALTDGVEESKAEDETVEVKQADYNIETYAGVERSKTFTYTIEETGDVDGISNDEPQTFKVTVTDNGQGKLTVTTDPTANALFSFTNTYSVTEEGSTPTDGSLTLSKTLTGRDMTEGEFSFEMVGTSDNAKGMKATGVNAAAADGEAGSVALSPITFKEPGTYEFQIREVNNKLGGVDYDASTLTAKAEVSSDGAGNMVIEWTVFDANGNEVTEKTFNNTYTAKDTSVVLGGTKVLDGRTLTEGEFQFKLADADGNEIQTVSNDAKGGFAFDKITYSDAGEYSYVITEVAPEDTDAETEGVQNNGVTYDTTTYTVKVVVEDDLKGNLKIAQLTYNDEAKLPIFTNTYTAPAEPEQGGEGDGDGGLFGMAKTGDFTGGIMAALAAVVAAAAAGATYAIRKMRRPRGRHAR
ncbi:MAG: FctA domain-containing protein, partial [Eggerthellaceae bacterium]|nr:FctA domain-containing protein [Eggerthellaceae bacterium]